MSYQYYDKWYDKNNTPYNKKKRETTMSIRDAPQEKVGKAHKKTTNERGRPGNPDHASPGLILCPETLDFIGFADLKDAA